MKIYLVQHGSNHSEDEDPQKGLTEQGAHDVENLARFVGKMNLEFEAIFHSEKKRAAQTASILGKHLKHSLGVHESDFLGPDDDVKVWMNRVLCSDADPILVGHLPFLERLASRLITQNDDQQVLYFQHGGMVCLEDENDSENFSVKWAITPDMLV